MSSKNTQREAYLRGFDAGYEACLKDYPNIGRPKGVTNSCYKLDKYKDDIKKYLLLKVNKDAISKLCNVAPSTLQRYLKMNPDLNIKD